MDDPLFASLAGRSRDAFTIFCEEARKLRVLIDGLPFPESSKQYEELLVQRLSESQALENYLQTSNHMFVHLQVRSAKPRSGPAL
jgi:hypothetical protein